MTAALVQLARRWDVVLIELIVVALISGSVLSPYFMNVDNLLSQTRDLMIVGFLALGLVPVVLIGEIDLSGESILAVCAVTLGLLFEAGVNIWVASGLIVLLGGLVGAVNGTLTVALRLPSLVVTLATLISLRGLAFVLVEDRPIVGFPESFIGLGNGSVAGTPIPQSLVAFVLVAIPVWFVLNFTVLGRWIYAIGSNASTARVSGVPVNWVRVGAFVSSGMMAGLAAIILAGRYDSVRADAGQGEILSVLTVVLLGGVSIFGGSGGLGGVALSLVLIGLIQNGMRLANISAEPQALVIGGLLIFSVVIPRIVYSLHERGRTKHAFTS